jgi:hypothetical protein
MAESDYFSPACGPGGDGWCTGRDLAGLWCSCLCHQDDDPPTTRNEARAWHGLEPVDDL